MAVVLEPDRTDPLVSVSLLFRAGAAFDPPGREGLANLVSDSMERGPVGVEFVEFSRRFERIGAEFSLGAGSELVHGDATFLSRHLLTGLDLVAGLLEAPAFRESDLETVRSLALSDLDAREDDLDDVAEDLFFHAAAGPHPYANLPHGTREGTRAVQPADLGAFHRRTYRPDRAHLAVVGDFDEEAVLRVLRDRFGRLPNPPEPAEDIPALPAAGEDRVVVKSRPEKGQARIFLGGPGLSANDPDRFGAIVANHVLGSSSIRSRLGDEIRDRLGLAYSVFSRNYERSRGGFFQVHVGTRPENVRRAVEAIRAELARITQGVTASELQDARDHLTGSFPLRFTTYGKLARIWARASFYGWPDDYLDTYVPRLRALEASDVRRAATRLVAGARVLAVAGPVDQDLEPLRDG
jgi:zinc protease